ncbi:MAG: glutathione peroxidase [Rhizobacter sp.]|nr:glutathione peroxidase [Chlorobiales bacterium]
MLKSFFILLIILSSLVSSPIYDISVKTIDGKSKSLADYKGKVMLIVNVASECGYTPQYAGLEVLHKKYQSQGLVVLGFPSNDFGGQEPGTNAEIKKFCSDTYNVSFALFDKVHAKGSEQHPLYKKLTSEAVPAGDIGWNFEKFLIGRDGNIVGRFKSKVTPDSKELTDAIEKALAAK